MEIQLLPCLFFKIKIFFGNKRNVLIQVSIYCLTSSITLLTVLVLRTVRMARTEQVRALARPTLMVLHTCPEIFPGFALIGE